MRGFSKYRTSMVFCLAVLSLGVSQQLSAQVTLLLEEPYSYDGTFAGTGHAAVYLSRVCADSPTVLRRCQPGERGAVISRYHGIAGRDWLAVPLIAYLYAVENPEDVPLFADSRLVAFLRRQYLDSLPLPAEKTAGSEPRYQLAGSAYDRTLYGFRFSTRPEQDDQLIAILNASPNAASYELLKSNCADFAKQIVNFYYPRAVHRSIVADLAIMTPKQAAKSLVSYSRHHPEVQLTSFIIPQVPGLKRSRPVHGVIESLVFAKKYVTPVLLFHPFVVGAVEAAYWTGWRFDPARGALIFNPAESGLGLERPLTAAERRAYASQLNRIRKASAEASEVADWRKLQSRAALELDNRGQAFREVPLGGRTVPLGLCRGNALRLAAPPELVEDLLLTRLEVELKPAKPIRTSEEQVESDWKLLEAAREQSRAALSADDSF
ncbi:MAG: hypothetical protein JO159_05640 [Acidobacteria bacterium]|nr:hypothetical protein [Acidobacteriota bacterium]MBV9624183.1 hypothetical protein [Acidobacteriota bacterium]